MTIALIDMDVVVYMCGFASQHTVYHCKDASGSTTTYRRISYQKLLKELLDSGINISTLTIEPEIIVDPISHCLQKVNNLIGDIVATTKASGYKGFLSTTSDKTLFRLSYAKTKEYKGNRKDFKKPHHYGTIRDYLALKHNTDVVEGIEADDALGIYQCSLMEPGMGIICSIDKDLLQIPGKHYNFKKREFYDIDMFNSFHNFYMQVLMGDKADNIPGLFKIGPSKAKQILEGCKTSLEMYEKCIKAYKLYSKMQDHMLYLHEMCHLLYILRGYNDSWRVPE